MRQTIPSFFLIYSSLYPVYNPVFQGILSLVGDLTMQKDIQNRLFCVGVLLAAALFLLLLCGSLRPNELRPAGSQILVKTQVDHETCFDQLHTMTIVEKGGRVCVFKDGLPWLRTEISVQALPEKDRTLLQEGIVVHTEQEMHQLLEDLGV